MTQADDNPPTDVLDTNQGPSGIGGWLILPILALVITSLLTANNLIQGLSMFTGEVVTVLRSQFPDILVMIAISTLVGVGCIVMAIYCLWLMFNHDRRTPNWMVAFYIVILVVTLFETVLANHMTNSFNDPSMNEGYGREIVRSIIACAIWIPYFNVSKRVKNTFVR